MKSIRNIRFVPVNDEGYKNYVADFIRKKHQKRQATDHIAVTIEDPIFDASRSLERIVRNMVGKSEIERVIRYESYDGWRWTRHYAECDFVMHSSHGLIISEIKATASEWGYRKGCKQLHRIWQLFEAVDYYEPVMFRLDIVDYDYDATSSVTFRYFDDMYIRVEYHPITKVIAYAKENGFNYDEQIIEKARRKANDRARNNLIEPEEDEALTLQPEPQTNLVFSDFALKLQNALSSCVGA